MAERKKRTRKHIIADLSVNHVEYQIYKNGFVMDVIKTDYGYDGTICTFTKKGLIENGNILIQLKATDSLNRYSRKKYLSYSISKKDIDTWSEEPYPVYLVLFDSKKEIAYWVYFQKYIELNGIKLSNIKNKSLSIHIDKTSVYNNKTPIQWRKDKTKILAQLKGILNHV